MAERTLTDKQSAFLDALFSEECEGNVRLAMTAAGYSPGTQQGLLIAALADEILDRSKNMIAAHSARATFVALNVMNNPTELGSDRALAASKEFLDRSGLVKKERIEVSGDSLGGVIFLPNKRTD